MEENGTWELNPWTGEPVFIPYNLPTQKTGWDWLNSILSGANNILSVLFPTGINNSGVGTQYPGGGTYVPPPTTGNNNTLFIIVGIGILFFLLRDKK